MSRKGKNKNEKEEMEEIVRGKVKVAKYYPGKPAPVTPGYRNIVIHTSDKNLGGGLSPYHLTVTRTIDGEEHDVIIENHWQFSKFYPEVYPIKTKLSRFHPNVIVWEHEEEIHQKKDGNPNFKYWDWREKGMLNPYAVRYPNGYKHRGEVLFSIFMKDEDSETYKELDYIKARKKIYCADYIEAALDHPELIKLKKLLDKGDNLQIVEVDGPDPYLDYWPYTKISPEAPGMSMNEKTIKFLLNDDNRAFGHGFVIAALLLDGADWLK